MSFCDDSKGKEESDIAGRDDWSDKNSWEVSRLRVEDSNSTCVSVGFNDESSL